MIAFLYQRSLIICFVRLPYCMSLKRGSYADGKAVRCKQRSGGNAELSIEVYPRSFQDTNDDGIGDLAGIITGSTIWLSWGWTLCGSLRSILLRWRISATTSPIIVVSIACSARLRTWINCSKAAHERGSEADSGFCSESHLRPASMVSRKPAFTRTTPKRDWYLWRDAAEDGGPPNNWLSNFGGPGWEWDAATGQYYYHSFLKQQPDVNWRNPLIARGDV